MGRQLERQDSDIEFQDYRPGCMWGILHILDHHYRHNAKKLPTRRKHSRGKRAICCANPKTVSFDHFPAEVHEYLDADAVPLLVEEQTIETNPANRYSGKAQIKELMAKEMASRSQLKRTDAFRCSEPSEHHLHGRKINWANPIIILHKSVDTTASKMQGSPPPMIPEELVTYDGNRDSLSQSRSCDKQLDRRTSCPQFKEHADVLEIFKVNKNIFLEILHDPNVQLSKQQTSNAKIRFKKSGSFPVAVSSHERFLRPSTLENKQKEVWYFPKGQKLSTGIQEPNSVTSKSLEYSYENSADNTGGAAIAQQICSSPCESSEGLSKHGWHQWHQSFTGHIRYIKKKIKHALKEGKKVNEHASIKLLHCRVPSECKFSANEKAMPEELMEITIDQAATESAKSHLEADSSEIDLRKSGQIHVRRASSINESMDRYAQLFEHSFSREAKWHEYQSKSLRLTNEDKFARSGHGLKSFKRRLSLPDLDSFCSFPKDISHDAVSSEIPVRNVSDCHINAERNNDEDFKPSRISIDREQHEPLHAFEETKLQKEMVERSNINEKKEHSMGVMIGDEMIKIVAIHDDEVEPENLEHRPDEDQEIGFSANTKEEHELEAHFLDNVTGPTEFPISDVSELDTRQIGIDLSDSSVDLQDKFSKDSLGELYSAANHENVGTVNIMADNYLLKFEFNRPDDPDFNYVRDVLEESGFIDQECIGKWHSIDQPLSPTLFKELEAYFHPESSLEDIGCNCNHQLLFDLINEELLEIYESSLAYFPKPFSFTTQYIHALPRENRVLEEVWKRISRYRNSNLENQSLDDIVGRDFTRRDSWMNLTFDVEDVALDLEDLIIDELLDEVIMCS